MVRGLEKVAACTHDKHLSKRTIQVPIWFSGSDSTNKFDINFKGRMLMRINLSKAKIEPGRKKQKLRKKTKKKTN